MTSHHFVSEGKASLSEKLRDPSLLREEAYLDGQWLPADGGGVLSVTNPADASEIGSVPDMGAAETERAIAAAARAWPRWRAMLAKDRGRILRRWADLMLDERDDLAVIMTVEQGKPLDEARGEIEYAASFLEWFGEEAKRLYGDTIPTHLDGSRLVVTREPIGVTACITPWNFPSAMITRKVGAALAAGCPMVVRPASETPFSALALAVLAERAGLPAGLFSVLTGSSRVIGKALTDSETVRKISFTGSTEVGRLLIGQSAETVKRVSMELGGHAPFIVFDDVDMDKAVRGAIAAKFQTTGQDCLAANRILVHRKLYDAFCARFAKEVAALKVGNGMEPGVQQGPLIGPEAVEKCEAHVRDALEKGARLLAGGERLDLGENFFQPTALADVTADMAIYREETFGPVAPVMPFDDEADAIRIANDTIYGLAAYLYTREIGRIWRVGEALEYGMVGINAVKMTGAPVPFGGVKQSGMGREGSRYGLDEYSEIKYYSMGDLDA
ncbi:MAG: NAD-dependent succinate-semialdehyde dehydrogenase [Rhodovibrionaceae bacterium]|nr:NAD-dependent succinate-semialdehyde dehydrogenase [Rhodovibrionaceae bacterium]